MTAPGISGAKLKSTMEEQNKEQLPVQITSQMIVRIEPQLRLSGDIDKIFDEVLKPTVAYNLTVSLTMEQVKTLLAWITQQELFVAANETIKAGGSVIPAQLLLEFIKAVEVILKGK